MMCDCLTKLVAIPKVRQGSFSLLLEFLRRPSNVHLVGGMGVPLRGTKPHMLRILSQTHYACVIYIMHVCADCRLPRFLWCIKHLSLVRLFLPPWFANKKTDNL